MKLFECIIDDGADVFKTLIAAKNKKAMLEKYGWNGNFEKIKDVTKHYFTDGTVSQLEDDLRLRGWGDGEIKLICALVQEHIRKTEEKTE